MMIDILHLYFKHMQTKRQLSGNVYGCKGPVLTYDLGIFSLKEKDLEPLEHF